MTLSEYINKTLLFIGLNEEEFSLEIDKQDKRVEIKIFVPEDITSRFIGAKGRNLYALQYLTRVVFREEYPNKNIVLDINSYREEKEEKLVMGAKAAARQVLETSREKVYRYLNSYERYLIHAAISEDEELEGVATYSANVGDQRWLTICLQEAAPEQDK